MPLGSAVSATPLRQLEVCGDCHRRIQDVASSTQLTPENSAIVRFQPVGLGLSTCFQKGSGLSCSLRRSARSSFQGPCGLRGGLPELSQRLRNGSTRRARSLPAASASIATCPAAPSRSNSCSPTTGSANRIADQNKKGRIAHGQIGHRGLNGGRCACVGALPSVSSIGVLAGTLVQTSVRRDGQRTSTRSATVDIPIPMSSLGSLRLR